MQNSINNYEFEIQNLLKNYFAEDDFKRLIFDSNHTMPKNEVCSADK